MGAVADGHLNRASDATRLADRLITLGYLERLSSPKDRRVVLVRVTSRGRDVFVRLSRRIKALHREQWKNLKSAELSELNTLLAKVLWDEREGAFPKHPLIAEGSTN
jgi:DNA-binding MarR family transcriptional regulator